MQWGLADENCSREIRRHSAVISKGIGSVLQPTGELQGLGSVPQALDAPWTGVGALQVRDTQTGNDPAELLP